MNRAAKAILGSLVFLAPLWVLAQPRLDSASMLRIKPELKSDTLPKPIAVADSISLPKVTTTLYKKNRLSPGRVILISTVLPGFGQIYNQSYWKLPVYYGLIGWFGYQTLTYHNRYAEFRDLYIQNLQVTPVPTVAQFNRRLRDFWRGVRDEFAIYVLLAYAAGLIDAYIDAHLFEFNVDDVATPSAATPNPVQRFNAAPMIHLRIPLY
jgi:hypothetical protein